MINKLKYIGRYSLNFWYFLCAFFTVICLLFFFISKFIKISFGRIPFSQVIFNTFTKTDGMTGAIKGLEIYVVQCSALFLLSFLFIISLTFILYKLLNKYPYIKLFAIFFFSITYLSISYFSLAYIEKNFQAISYFKKENSNFIYDNYYRLDRSSIEFKDGKKSNLILIFVESLEKGYSNKDVYGENLIPSLSAYLSEGISFDNFQKVQGAYFTIDGISAQTTGMPLLQLPDDFHMIPTDSYGSVMSNTAGVFNVLKDQGYQTVSFIGSPGWFTNMNLFLEKHGIQVLHDRNSFVDDGYELNEKTLGFHDSFRDDFLIEKFKEYLTNQIDPSKNFGAVIQTYDTHFPSGFCPKEFKKHGEDNIFDAWLYTDYLVGGFLDWAKTQSWYNNTVIIVVGDHPWQDSNNDFSNLTKKDNLRQIYNLIIHSRAKKVDNSCSYSNIDMAPTILNALGISFRSFSNSGKQSNSKLGLGVSLFSDEKTLVCTYGKDDLINKLSKYSFFYDTLQ